MLNVTVNYQISTYSESSLSLPLLSQFYCDNSILFFAMQSSDTPANDAHNGAAGRHHIRVDKVLWQNIE